AEGLLLAGVAARQVHGALRDLEVLAVPLEYRGLVAQRRQHRIAAAGLGGLQAVPADLGRVVALDRRAQRMRQQLRAKADAEHRLALSEHALDGLEFGAQV